MKNLLFICTHNLQRSPTAERLFAVCEDFNTRSAGTDPAARAPVTQELIDWADAVFVMSEKEDRHLSALRSRFDVGDAPVYDLDIPDRFIADDITLQHKLIERVGDYIDISSCRDKLLSAVRS